MAVLCHAHLPTMFAATGGPDDYGYTFTDSDELGGPDFEWIDITSTGDAIISSGDDTSSGPVELGFPVVLYGEIQTHLVAGSNGYLSTDPEEKGIDATPDCPLPEPPSDGRGTRLYALHDDLTLDDSSAAVYYQYFKTSPHPHSEMGVSIFTWHNLRFDGGSALPLNFQVLLFDDGDILFQYDTSGLTWGATSTVGLQYDDASVGLTYSCKTAGAITDALAVAFSPPTITITQGIDFFDTPSGPQVTLREALRDIPSGGRIVFATILSETVMNLASNFGSLEIPDGKAVHIDPGDLGDGVLVPFEVTGRNLSEPIFQVGEDALLTMRQMRLTAANGGGAVKVDSDSFLRMQDCLVRDNETSNEGGAVDFNGQTGIFVKCEFDSNTAGDGGGAIASDSNSTICVISSTFYDNKAGTYGGAIFARDELEILNSTLAHNQAGLDGGALRCGDANLQHNTIVGNITNSLGAGIRVQAGTVEMGHTILAENLGSNIKLVTGGAFNSLGHNLTDGDFAGFTASDQTETDPHLAPLGHYGGGLPSCLPLAGSPVIDGGIYAANPPGLPVDQRGFARIVDGDKNSIAFIDIGAVESQDYLVVDTAVDENDNPAGANLSLREALRDADFENGQQIRIDPSLSGDTIDLTTLGVITALEFAIIDGSPLDEPLKLTSSSSNSSLLKTPTINFEMTLALIGLDFVDTDGSERAVNVFGRTNATLADCRFLRNVSTSTGGAAVLSTGEELFISGCLFSENEAIYGAAFHCLTPERIRITESYFTGNTCQLDGGAGYINNPKFPTIANSTFDRNISFTNRGGALYSVSRYMPLRLTQVTFSQNQSVVEGGAIFCSADALVPIIITHCTFVANTGFIGAALAMTDGDDAKLTGNLFFRNTDQSLNPDAFALVGAGQILSEGHNLIDADEPLLDHGEDILLPGEDFHLGPLTWNGGAVPTFHPLVASPALDRIQIAGAHCRPLADARGYQRPQDSDDFLPNPEAMDIGAVEAARAVVVTSDNDAPFAQSPTITLREAISLAEDGGRIIVEPEEFETATVLLDSNSGGQGTELEIDKSLMIDGTGGATGISIVAADGERVLNVIGADSQVALHAVSALDGNSSDATGGGTTGGGIRVADARLTLSQCAIASCEAGTDGGGMLVNNAWVLLENVSLDENTAADEGGAIFAWNGSELIVRHSTISFNTSARGGAGFHLVDSSALFFSSVVGVNYQTDGDLANMSTHSGATVESDGFNLTDGNFLPGISDVISTFPNFNFRAGGGLASARAPGFESPIVDAGPLNVAIPAQDVRGAVRKWGPKVDIGALEMGTLLVDNDNDLMDDVWELYYGLAPNDGNDAGENPDFDGEDNLGEYQGMTHPWEVDVIALPNIIEWEYTAGFLQGSFISAPGVEYNMLLKRDLGDATWFEVPFTGAANAAETEFNFPPYQPIADQFFLKMEIAD